MNDPGKKLRELLAEFSVAMFTTRTASGQLRSRPMALGQIEADATLWFLTQRDADKLADIAIDSQANVSMQSASRFVSLSGKSAPVEDPGRVKSLWSESWKVWFPGGVDDPSLQLLRFDSEVGEYWDNSGLSGIRYLIEAGRAYLAGSKPLVDGNPEIHAKVKL